MGELKTFIMPLTGRLITAYDGTKIVQSGQDGVEVNFKTLVNMVYTDKGPIGTPGMSKINSTALSSYPRIENIFQYRKTQPDESHVLVHTFDTNEDNGKVFTNDTAIPDTGDFTATALHTDTRSSGSITAFAVNGTKTKVTSAGHGRQSGEDIVISGTTSYNGLSHVESATANTFVIDSTFVADDATGTWATRLWGRFSAAPLSHLNYCNGEDNMIWGGDESKVAGFILFDANAGTFTKDFTEQVKNTKTDSDNIATMTKDGAGTPTVSLYVGSVLPLDAIKFYVVTANTTTGTLSVDYWDGSAWQSVSSLSDGTASGGKPFAVTGKVAFATTATTAKTSMREGILGFWYRVQITNCDNTTTISRVTLGIPFQKLQDLWDQAPRKFAKAYHLDSSSRYNDITINVSQDSYFYDTGASGGDDSSYFDIGGLASPDLIFGTFERIQGIQFKLIPGQKNTTASTTMTVSYWTGSAWATFTITDNTSISSISMAQSGFVTWHPKEENIEFRQSIVGGEGQYFYKVSLNKTVSASPVNIFFTSYIPVQKLLQGYRFGLHAKNRLMLFGDETGDKNKMIVSARNTVNVFNGVGSGDPIFFGEPGLAVVSAVEIFARFTATLQSLIVVCQDNTTSILFGDNPEDWRRPSMPVSNTIGCSAPLTMKASPIGFEFSPLQTKQVAVWIDSNGVYMFDVEHGLNVISGDIQDLFNQDVSGSINLKAIEGATSTWKVSNGEYHYHVFMPTGTSVTNNTEIVFDLKRHKWSTIDRTRSQATNKDLQVATEIKGEHGQNYTYGTVDDGYLERLNFGNTFDGNNIETEFSLADVAFEKGNTLLMAGIRHVQIPQVAKTNTVNDITVTHVADGQDTASTFTLSPLKSGRRLAIPAKAQGAALKEGVYHSLGAKLTTNDETVAFEPLSVAIKYEVIDRGSAIEVA